MFPGLVRLYNHTSITIHVHSCEMYNMCIYYCYFFKFQRRIQMFSNPHQRHSWSYVSTNDHILLVLFQVISNWLFFICVFGKECAANPCLNSAYCQSESTGNFRCLCQEGFWGKYCENGIMLWNSILQT